MPVVLWFASHTSRNFFVIWTLGEGISLGGCLEGQDRNLVVSDDQTGFDVLRSLTFESVISHYSIPSFIFNQLRYPDDESVHVCIPRSNRIITEAKCYYLHLLVLLPSGRFVALLADALSRTYAESTLYNFRLASAMKSQDGMLQTKTPSHWPTTFNEGCSYEHPTD